MMCAPPHGIPQLIKRKSLPQTDNSDLQREVARVTKSEGLVKRLNHHELNDEENKMQIDKEIEGCVCCKSRCNAHCIYEKIQKSFIFPLRENCHKEMLKSITIKWVRS